MSFLSPSVFPQAFFSLSFLERLDLSWNLLTSLPVDFSASLSALRELRLQHNSLHQLTGYRYGSVLAQPTVCSSSSWFTSQWRRRFGKAVGLVWSYLCELSERIKPLLSGGAAGSEDVTFKEDSLTFQWQARYLSVFALFDKSFITGTVWIFHTLAQKCRSQIVGKNKKKEK